jgi:YVTN family beta-propeller protein
MLFLAAADYLAGVADAASKVTCTISGDEITVATGADAGKVLDQRQLAAAAATIYTVPAGTVTVVKTIIVVNTDTVTRTFQLFRGGTGAGNAITSLISLAAGYAWVRDDSGDHVTDTLGQLAYAMPGYQPLDSDLTAIAALPTTTYGRAFLTLAGQAALAALVQTPFWFGVGCATVTVGTGPYAVAVTPSGAYAYVPNNASNSVSVIRTSDNTVVATVTVGTGPIGVAVTPSGAYAYVANYGSNSVSLIRTSHE